MKPYVFIAGPIRTSGVLEHNVREAALLASHLSRMGFVPFVPHLNILWNFVDPLPEAHWKAWDRDWLERCDAVYRRRGKSVGADEEVAFAKERGIPVFYDMESIVAWWNCRMDEHSRKPEPAPAAVEDLLKEGRAVAANVREQLEPMLTPLPGQMGAVVSAPAAVDGDEAGQRILRDVPGSGRDPRRHGRRL